MAVISIVGGQYGSEGKGVIAHKIADGATAAVRTGGPNAGHSIIYEGRVWKMRSIPVAWTNPKTLLIIGRGAVVDPNVLMNEVNALELAGYHIRDRLYVDSRATIIRQIDIEAETQIRSSSGSLVDRIGSTGKGIGSARIRRISRDLRSWQTPEEALPLLQIADTAEMIRPYVDTEQDEWVMLEGTQGFGLSLTHGEWPYVTSADITIAQMWNDAGIFPLPGNHGSIMVFRSYPIRVAGNSGPLWGETSWEEMSTRLGKPIEERTTVTNKVRRIGHFNWELAREAVKINRPAQLALTFADYIDPVVEGVTEWNRLTPIVRTFIERMEDTLGVSVGMVGTGGPQWSVILRPTHQIVLGWRTR